MQLWTKLTLCFAGTALTVVGIYGGYELQADKAEAIGIRMIAGRSGVPPQEPCSVRRCAGVYSWAGIGVDRR